VSILQKLHNFDPHQVSICSLQQLGFETPHRLIELDQRKYAALYQVNSVA